MQPSPVFVPCNSKEKSTAKLEPAEARVGNMHSDDLVGPACSIGTDINIRPRSAVKLNTFDGPGLPQGIAGRRIRLQSPQRASHGVNSINVPSIVSTGATEVTYFVRFLVRP